MHYAHPPCDITLEETIVRPPMPTLQENSHPFKVQALLKNSGKFSNDDWFFNDNRRIIQKRIHLTQKTQYPNYFACFLHFIKVCNNLHLIKFKNEIEKQLKHNSAFYLTFFRAQNLTIINKILFQLKMFAFFKIIYSFLISIESELSKFLKIDSILN